MLVYTTDNPKRAKGSVLAEAAVIIPILLLILFALIDFGWVLFTKQAMQQAAQEGARILATSAGTIASAEDSTKTRLENAGAYKASMVIKGYDPYTGSGGTGRVAMEITVPISALTLTGDPFRLFGNPTTIKALVIMRKET